MPYEISKIKWFPRMGYFKVVIKTGDNPANEQIVLSKKRVALENYIAEFVADRTKNAGYTPAHMGTRAPITNNIYFSIDFSYKSA